MWKKKEEIKEEKEENLLKELCKDDTKLYNCLSNYLLLNPLAGISKKDLDALTEEAEKYRKFGPAMDKAIFEAAQNPGERERYIKVIRKLASKTIHTTEQEIENIEKEGLTDQGAYLLKRIENSKFLSDRTEDIINIASIFYMEVLLKQEENTRREDIVEARRSSEWNERRSDELEKSDRKAKKNKRRGMDRAEKRAAKNQDKKENLAKEEKKIARGEKRKKAEEDELIIAELENAGRIERKNKRKKN